MGKKKSVITLLLIAIISILFSMPTQANDENDKVKVGYMSYRSFIEKRDNKYRGFGVEFLQELARYQDLEYEFIKAPWDDLMMQLEKGEIDLLCTAEKNEDRENRFLFSQEPLGYVNTILYTRNDMNLYFEDYPSYNDLKVGVLKNSMQYEIFLQCQEENNFTTNITFYPEPESMDQALNDKKIDAIITESLDKRSDLKLLARFNSKPFYFMSNKQNISLMNKIDNAMQEITNNTPYFQTDLYYKYYGGNQISVSPAYTKEEIEYIKKSEPIQCGYFIDAYPSTYKSEDKAKGIIISLMDEVARMSGLKVNYVPLRSYEEGFNAIKEQKIDFLLNHSSYFNEEITNIKYASDAMYKLPLTLVSKKDYLNETRGLEFGIIREMYQTMESELKHLLQIENVTYYETYEDVLQAIQTDKIDFTIVDSYYVNSLLKSTAATDLKSSIVEASIPIDIGYGQHVDMTTRKIINKTIPFLSDDKKNEIIQALRSESTNKDISNYDSYIRALVLISVALIALLVFIYLYNSQRFKKSKEYDALCDCFNLKTFKEKASLALKEDIGSKRYLVAIDLENFSYVNHYYGTKAGDEVLKLFSSLVQRRLCLNDLLGRVSKDDFVLYINEHPSSRDNLALENLPDEIVKALNLDLKLNIKIGIYEIHDPKEDISMMIEKALLVKRNIEKDAICKYYTPEMDKDYETMGKIKMNKEHALKNKEFVVYYQPKIDLISEKIVGAEALIRWIQADGTILSPDTFIPIFEKDGFIKKLDMYTLKNVCIMIRENAIPFRVSVNQSRILLNDEDYIYDVKNILKMTKVDPSKLEMEVTESIYARDKKRLRNVMDQLHELDISVSMDDFGSGYSSMNLLTELPVETVKIDKSVLDSEAHHHNRETLIRNIINMAHEMNMHVVCEGVETKEQRDMLERLKCDIAQGYYYAKPMNLEDFLAFVKEHQK